MKTIKKLILCFFDGIIKQKEKELKMMGLIK